MQSTGKIRWTAASIAAVALTGSLTMAACGAASASAEVAVTPAAKTVATQAKVFAAPCGLSLRGPVNGLWHYTIRNCHSSPVKRKLNLKRPIIGKGDGLCHYIQARSSVSSWIKIPAGVTIAGIKPC